ncbi:hypothetical protein L810_1160 [Burkholderia sp. AU4i]|uniref:hypothetical protein n=1 Tax=Burkholderia sp. AU4i TaxID=1335308 RepID=UPI0003988857|nr:hypothetical protein [Burkholderia sp. AU4i]ERJ35903.1 hypothetical protein L810_1160 [Burkholderia sp. AU4i]
MMKSYTSTLVDIRGGMLVEEATAQLNQLVSLVRDTGKAGKISVTIEIKPFAKVADALEVSGEVSTTLPKEKRAAEVFFPTVENNLSRNSERQPDLPGIQLAGTGTDR